MKTFQTNCPSCHHVFTITESQLKFKNGLARCGHCKNIFSAIDNLVQQKELTPSQQQQLASLKAEKKQDTSMNTNSSVKSEKTQNKTEVVSFDDLLNETVADTSSNNVQTAPPKSQEKTATPQTPVINDVELDIIEDFDTLPDVQHSKSVLSNVDGQENFTEQEETWLEDLLAKESKKAKNTKPPADLKITPMHREANDVSNLLDQFGVNVSEETSLEQHEYLKKLQKRFDQKPTSQQIVKKSSTGMLVVWVISCLLLSGLLVVQYTIFNLNTLIKDPKVATQIDSVCTALYLPCDLPSTDLSHLNVQVIQLDANGEKSDLLFSLTNQDTQKSLLYPDLKINLQMGDEIVSQMIVPVSKYADGNSRLRPQQNKAVKLRIHLSKKQFEQANIEAFY